MGHVLHEEQHSRLGDVSEKGQDRFRSQQLDSVPSFWTRTGNDGLGQDKSHRDHREEPL